MLVRPSIDNFHKIICLWEIICLGDNLGDNLSLETLCNARQSNVLLGPRKRPREKKSIPVVYFLKPS